MQTLSRKSKILLAIAIVALVVGVADALYLTVKHYAGGPVSCGIIEGCSVVLASSWSTILGLPTALYGAVYYGLALSGLVLFFTTRRELFFQLSLALLTIGLVVSLGFLYLQIFVIAAFCQFCLLSLVTTVLAWSCLALFSRAADATIKSTDA